jgi:hypothetical protein
MPLSTNGTFALATFATTFATCAAPVIEPSRSPPTCRSLGFVLQ